MGSQQQKRSRRTTHGLPVEWDDRDISQVDVRTQAVLVRCCAHDDPTASKDRLNLPQDEGGRGPTIVKLMWEREVMGCSHLPACPGSCEGNGSNGTKNEYHSNDKGRRSSRSTECQTMW